MRSLFWSVAVTWVALDQATKAVATRVFATDPVDLGVVRLVDVRNPNAAFDLPGFPGLFVTVTAVVVVLVLRALPTTRRPALGVAYGLVVGGAVGNVVDRLLRDPGFPNGAVVDWIDLGWFPVFNVADSGITVGAALVALLLARDDDAGTDGHDGHDADRDKARDGARGEVAGPRGAEPRAPAG